jgi:hypothetical protein
MCRIPRVIVIAPKERHQELRQSLSALEYDIVAAASDPADVDGITADVAVVLDADPMTTATLKARGLKVVAVGGDPEGADMALAADALADFKTRVWELFRA